MIRSILIAALCASTTVLYGQSETQIKIDTVYYTVRKCRDCPETIKSIIFTLLRCGLYEGSDGTLTYRHAPGKDDSTQFKPRYIPWVSTGLDRRIKDRELIQLHDVIDTSTFVTLSKYYRADKKNIYGFIPIRDTGILFWLEQADRKTFVVLPGEMYTKDKNHVYFRGSEVKGADTKTFRILTHPELNELACDSRSFYQVGKKMEDIEVKAYKLETYKKSH